MLLFVLRAAVCEASKAGGIEWTMTPVNTVAATRCPQSFSGASSCVGRMKLTISSGKLWHFKLRWLLIETKDLNKTRTNSARKSFNQGLIILFYCSASDHFFSKYEVQNIVPGKITKFDVEVSAFRCILAVFTSYSIAVSASAAVSLQWLANVLIGLPKFHCPWTRLSIGTDLDDLEWPWTAYQPLFCVYSPNSIALQADYVTVVEDRPIVSVKYSPSSSLQLLAKTNAPWSAVSLQ